MSISLYVCLCVHVPVRLSLSTNPYVGLSVCDCVCVCVCVLCWIPNVARQLNDVCWTNFFYRVCKVHRRVCVCTPPPPPLSRVFATQMLSAEEFLPVHEYTFFFGCLRRMKVTSSASMNIYLCIYMYISASIWGLERCKMSTIVSWGIEGGR